MGISFIFDVNSQHQYTAPQSVVYTTDLSVGPYYGFNTILYAVPAAPVAGLGSAINSQWIVPAGTIGAITGKIKAVNAQVDLLGNANVDTAIGLAAVMNAGSPCTTARGVDSKATVPALGSVTNCQAGVFASQSIAGSTVTNITGALCTVATNSGSNILGTVHGIETKVACGNNAIPAGNVATIQIQSTVGTALPQTIGLEIQDQTVGLVDNFAIKTGLGKVQFGGQFIAAGGMNMKQTRISNAAYGVLASDTAVVQIGAMTASRAWTLPAASAVPEGHVILFSDESGSVTGVNTIVLTRAGADTINGASTASIILAYGAMRLMSNGVSKWTII